MRFLSLLFTWWNGATLGTLTATWLGGKLVGEDVFGNRYYGGSRNRRWVIYRGYAEPSTVPPEWHGWLHHTFDQPPTEAPPAIKPWEKEAAANMTGTPYAYRPKGSLYGRGQRDHAVGDYEPWRPGQGRPEQGRPG